MTETIDLHVHSTCSDGTNTPTELVNFAIEKGLRAFALTDHDTTAGIEEALDAAKEKPIEIIPGIELSTNYKGKDIHILGLGVDCCNAYFQVELSHFQNSRDARNLKMITKLQESGVVITHESMLEAFGDAIWTRAHFARYLYEHHYVKSMKEAFECYIGDHAPCFVQKEKVTPYQAIQLIHQGGGVAILAHPLLYHFSDANLEQLVMDLRKDNLDAIEAIYSTNKWTDESNLIRLAKKHNLKISGGSDYHGANKPTIALGTGRGNLKIPYEIWQTLIS